MKKFKKYRQFNMHDIREVYFGTFHFGISIVLLLWRQKIKYELLSNRLF